MSKISRVEVFQVDLAPKVVRSDAIQAFSKQETPMVRIWTDDEERTAQVILTFVGGGGGF